MGWRRRVRTPSPHRRSLRACDIGAVPVLHCPLLVLRRFGFCHKVRPSRLQTLYELIEVLEEIPGVEPCDSYGLRSLRRSGDGLSFTSGGFDSGRQKVCPAPLYVDSGIDWG
jgi:hypothetical protein